MSKRILVCWVGGADIRASQSEGKEEGPIAGALAEREFDAVLLLSDYAKAKTKKYVDWLQPQVVAPITVDHHQLESPTDFDAIFPACRKSLQSLQKRSDEHLQLTFHLSPGTPHMASTWLILSESEFPARLIDTSKEAGVRDVRLPVSLDAEWLPAYIKNRDSRLEGAAPELPPPHPQFQEILHGSEIMRSTVQRANRVAARSVPVLIEGESGTGKELFSRAIHEASLRSGKPFVAVNCGALPSELIESTLFGHEKGAFTGATATQSGKFEQADGGTLFLDELGELPLEAQVRFLRVLEDKEVWRLGAKEARKVDVRIIAATNRSLMAEVAAGRFREDLFYRLAVAVLKLPPLRQRGGDIKLLIRHLLAQVNEESKEEPSYQDKKLSPEGEKIMLEHAWPGNVRELLNTLRRLAVWSEGEVISPEDVRESLLVGPAGFRGGDDILGQEIGQNFDLGALLERVERYYIEKAWAESGRRKVQSANLLGIAHYQTFGQRLTKYGLD